MNRWFKQNQLAQRANRVRCMIYDRCSFTSRGKIVRSLNAIATDTLRKDQRKRSVPAISVDLLSDRDTARRERRREALIKKNMVVPELFVSLKETRSTEVI